MRNSQKTTEMKSESTRIYVFKDAGGAQVLPQFDGAKKLLLASVTALVTVSATCFAVWLVSGAINDRMDNVNSTRWNASVTASKGEISPVTWEQGIQPYLIKTRDTELGNYALISLNEGSMYMCAAPCQNQWYPVVYNTNYLEIFSDPDNTDYLFFTRWSSYYFVAKISSIELPLILGQDPNSDSMITRFNHHLEVTGDHASGKVVKVTSLATYYQILDHENNVKQIYLCPANACNGVYFLIFDSFSGLEVTESLNENGVWKDVIRLKDSYKYYGHVMSSFNLIPALMDRVLFQSKLTPIGGSSDKMLLTELDKIRVKSIDSLYVKYILTLNNKVYICTLPCGSEANFFMDGVKNIWVKSDTINYTNARTDYIFAMYTTDKLYFRELAMDKLPKTLMNPQLYQNLFEERDYQIKSNLAVKSEKSTSNGQYVMNTSGDLYFCYFTCMDGIMFKAETEGPIDVMHVLSPSPTKDAILLRQGEIWRRWNLTPHEYIFGMMKRPIRVDLLYEILSKTYLDSHYQSKYQTRFATYFLSSMDAEYPGNMFLCPSFEPSYCFPRRYGEHTDLFVVPDIAKNKQDYLFYKLDNEALFQRLDGITEAKIASWVTVTGNINPREFNDDIIRATSNHFQDNAIVSTVQTVKNTYHLDGANNLWACQTGSCEYYFQLVQGVVSFSAVTVSGVKDRVVVNGASSGLTLWISSIENLMLEAQNGRIVV
jgi:hypothetical protein